MRHGLGFLEKEADAGDKAALETRNNLRIMVFSIHFYCLASIVIGWSGKGDIFGSLPTDYFHMTIDLNLSLYLALLRQLQWLYLLGLPLALETETVLASCLPNSVA